MEVKTIETSCKDCIFAEYEGITQISCKLDMVNKHKEKGVQVDECFDEDKEFYVIRTRQCMSKRLPSWKYHGLPKDEQIKKIDIETNSMFHAIIIGSPYINDTISTIQEVNNQTYKPQMLTVINLFKNSPLKLINELKKCTVFKWELDNVVDDNEDNVYKLVHKNVKKYNVQFYSIFVAGRLIRNNFLESINNYVKDMNQFACIKPDIGMHGLVVPLHVHYHWWYTGSQENIINEMEDIECKTGQKLVVTI